MHGTGKQVTMRDTLSTDRFFPHEYAQFTRSAGTWKSNISHGQRLKITPKGLLDKGSVGGLMH